MQKDTKDTGSSGETDGKAAATGIGVGQKLPGTTAGSLSFGSMPGLPKLGDSAGFAKFKESLKSGEGEAKPKLFADLKPLTNPPGTDLAATDKPSSLFSFDLAPAASTKQQEPAKPSASLSSVESHAKRLLQQVVNEDATDASLDSSAAASDIKSG